MRFSPAAPAPLHAGVRSVHVGTAILLPNQQYPVVREQPRIPEGAPTQWSPWISVQVDPTLDLQGKPCLGDARWTPPGLWDILGLGNCYERWPNSSTNPHPGPVTKVAFGTLLSRYAAKGDALRPTPSIPLPQPIIEPGYGIMGGIRAGGA